MKQNQEDALIIAGRKFSSRFIIEITGFKPEILPGLLKATGNQIVTHTLQLTASGIQSPDDLNPQHLPSALRYIPNTHGCKTAEEAIESARAIRAAGISDWIKLEVTPNNSHYMSDGIETLKAAETLVREGFTVLPYMHADPLLAKRLEEVGCATVMPLGSPIGTGKGIQTKEFIEMIVDTVNIPVVVDAGIGMPSHATEAMQIGAGAVIVHTAILYSENPLLQAHAFNLAVQAGRASYLAKGNYAKFQALNPK